LQIGITIERKRRNRIFAETINLGGWILICDLFYICSTTATRLFSFA